MNEIDDLQHRGAFAPSGEPSLRWGVLGTGGIANVFVGGTRQHTEQRIVAVGSRTGARSEAFAAQYGLERSHASYSALIEDPGVDAVYVGLTADLHRDLALEAIAAGKPVLVEKPFATNAAEAAEIRDAARAAGVLAMEAMWTRYLPQSDAIRRLREQGVLGDVELVMADHGQAHANQPGSRLLRADLGGGAMLDLGVYPIAFASEVLGSPSTVKAVGDLLESGVDGSVGLLLAYAGSTAQAVLSTTMTVATPTTAVIAGSEARLDVERTFYVPSGFSVTGPQWGAEPTLRWRDQTGVVGHEALSYQATALARFVAEGRTESPLLGLDESVSILETIDAARAQLTPYAA